MKLLNQHQSLITNYMYLGLLPFFTGALGPWILANHEWWFTQMFLWYSTIIYSFLAGTIWALALFSNLEENNASIRRHIHAAIIFSIIPLFAVLLSASVHTGIMLLAFLLLLSWEKLFINSHYPHWYQELRHRITFIAVACHMLVIWNIIRT